MNTASTPLAHARTRNGLLLFLVAELVTMGALLASVAYLAGGAGIFAAEGWLWPGIVTALWLLLGSIFLGQAGRERDIGNTYIRLISVIAFSAIALLRQRELTVALAASPAADLLRFTVLFHALHSIGGMVAVAWTAVRLYRRGVADTHLLSLYWHFLLATWLAVLGVAYALA